MLLVAGIAACGPKSSAPGSNEATASTDTPVSMGGVDGSGGGASQSTEEQVVQAAQDLKKKLLAAWSRIAWVYIDVQPESFDRNLGEGSHALLKGMLEGSKGVSPPVVKNLRTDEVQIEIKQSGACEGDGRDNDGSAIGSGGKGKICLSASRLRRLAPESLEKEVLSLAAHELAHLYGYDQAQAQAVQDFFLRHPSLVSPSADASAKLREFGGKVDFSNYNIEVLFYDKASASELCGELASLRGVVREYMDLLMPRKGEAQLPASALLDLGVASTLIGQAMGFCGSAEAVYNELGERNQVDAGDRKALLRNLRAWREALFRVAAYAGKFADPESPQLFLKYHRAGAALQLLETPEYAELEKIPSSRVKDLRPEDVACRQRLLLLSPDGSPTDQAGATDMTFRPNPIYSDAQGSLFSAGYNDRIVVRKMNATDKRPSLGVDVAVMSAAIRNVVIEQGLVFETVDTDGVSRIPSSRLVRGVNEAFQVTYDEDVKQVVSVRVTVRCQILDRKQDAEKAKSLEIKP